MSYTLKKTQDIEAEFWKDNGRIFNASDPGTGKTLATLEGYKRSIAGRLLVLAPLTILRSSWGDDIDKFMPGFSWAVAHGNPKKREDAFKSNADIVLMNHDGVNWLNENRKFMQGFSHLAIDEFTAFKNRSANRSKACCVVANEIENLTELSGTPNSKSITDIWHPAFMLDQGQRLGQKFWEFRSQVCTPIQVGPDPQMVQWKDKPGALEMVTARLADVTVRHKLTDLPENVTYTLNVDMPTSVMKQYRDMEQEAVVETNSGVITAVNAGVKVKKLLQILSGAAYDAFGNVVKVHPHRMNLVIELVMARRHSVVAFNWRHERDGLIALAERYKIPYAYIDGTVPANVRADIVRDYQAGKYQVLFAQPQSAGHGLTLTRGKSTIWTSPTYSPEIFTQFNRRIYRTGQDEKTETICICARGTREEQVYDVLNNRLADMNTLLDIFATNTGLAA